MTATRFFQCVPRLTRAKSLAELMRSKRSSKPGNLFSALGRGRPVACAEGCPAGRLGAAGSAIISNLKIKFRVGGQRATDAAMTPPHRGSGRSCPGAAHNGGHVIIDVT